MKNTYKNFFKIISLILVFIFLLFCIILSTGLGAVHIPPRDVFSIFINKISGTQNSGSYPATWNSIIFEIRLPRVILGTLVGMTLAIAGAVFQAIFRNPLADPYLMGVSSGASFGATLSIYFVWQFSWGGFDPVSLSAFCGALITIFAIYNLSKVGKRTPVTLLILAGVALGSILTAGTSFLMITADSAYKTINALDWLFGTLAYREWKHVIGILPYLGIGFVVLAGFSHHLNVLQLDEYQAQALGIKVERTKMILIFATSLATAAAVSVSGLIGFVGLVIPHIVRLIWGPDHRFLLPMSGLLGACVLILSDSLARIVLAPRELPVGIVTAFIGAPFFLYLLRKQKRNVM